MESSLLSGIKHIVPNTYIHTCKLDNLFFWWIDKTTVKLRSTLWHRAIWWNHLFLWD